ncbi:MAG: serine hydrolase domain-containing protein [Bacteroidota bacterium]
MKKIVPFLLLTTISTFGQTIKQDTYNKIKQLAKYFPNGTELSIGIIENSQRIFYGLKKENDSLVITSNQNKLFEIGSITKVFTAILIADLSNKGVVSLSDDLQKYYSFKIKYDNNQSKNITILSLCNHTSGLPKNAPNSSREKSLNKKQLSTYLKKGLKLEFETGSKFGYSNLGFAILGDILCKSTKKTYSVLLKENILLPLKMLQTSSDKKNIDASLIVSGRDSTGNMLQNPDYGVYESAGAILSSASDILNFLDYNFFTKSSIDQDILLAKQATYKINDKVDIGLAWDIYYKENDTIYFHDGATTGYTSSLKFSQNRQKGIIVLSNLSGVGQLYENIDKISYVLLNEE